MGARLCEFFFVASGFLFYISNSKRSDTNSFPNALHYVRKKVVALYPAHLYGFVAALLRQLLEQPLSVDMLINALLNLGLVQAWVNNENVFFGYNGVSWYISALIFCYFMGFALLNPLRDKNKAFTLLWLIFAIRYGLEAIPIAYPGLFWSINPHASPLVRVCEFWLGMVAASFFLQIQAKFQDKISFWFGSLLECGSLLLLIYLLITREGLWLRGAYIIPFCIFVLCFAFDKGVLSAFLSIKPIQWISKYQLEIYLFHVLVFRWVEYRYPLAIQMPIYIGALAAAIFVYRMFIREPVANWVNNKTEKIETWFSEKS